MGRAKKKYSIIKIKVATRKTHDVSAGKKNKQQKKSKLKQKNTKKTKY